MPRYETFKKSLVAVAQQPHITIQKRGTITINAAAYAALGSPEAVELLYDSHAHLLGIRSVATSIEHAAYVRPSTRSGNGPYIISAMAFIKHYDIDTSQARRFDATLTQHVLSAELAGPFTAVSKATPLVAENKRRPRPRPSHSGGVPPGRVPPGGVKRGS